MYTQKVYKNIISKSIPMMVREGRGKSHGVVGGVLMVNILMLNIIFE